MVGVPLPGEPERLDALRKPDVDDVRVVAVVDCFDALTSARAYRAALPKPKALELLRAGAGSHFDPALLLPFIDRVARNVEPAAMASRDRVSDRSSQRINSSGR